MGTGKFNPELDEMLVYIRVGGSRNTPSHFMITVTGHKPRPERPLGLYADILTSILQPGSTCT